MIRPLENIKVLDFTLAGAGPSCTKLLAEYGADVIWVEPVTGTSTRDLFKFDFYTTGKRSLALNVKAQKGRDAFLRILSQADVFVTNYRTAALERLGFDYPSLKEVKPDLIYASLTGYGTEGPDADQPGYDPVAFWARGGLLRDFAEKGQLLVPPVAVGDIAAGQSLAGGVCAALFYRQRTGKGCNIFTSLFAEAIYLNHDAIVESQFGESYPKSRLAPKRALLNSYRCADGKWIVITITSNFDRYFDKLLIAIGRNDLVGDSRWKCFEDTMYDKAPELVAILDEAFSKMTQDEAMAALRAIDVPVSRVQSSVEAMNDPQTIANHYVYPITSVEGRTLIVPANPLKFEDINSGVVGKERGPMLGEHTVEVLKEYGLSDQDIQDMIDDGTCAIA